MTISSLDYHYQDLADLSGEGIILHKHGTIIDVNLAACRLLGYKEKELKEKDIFSLISQEDATQMRNNIGKKRKVQREIQLLKKDTTTIWGKITFKTILFKDQEVGALIFRDVTARKEMEFVAAKSEERYKRLSEASFEAILIHQDGQIIDCNTVTTALFGYTKEELLTMRAYDLALEDDQQFIKDQVAIGIQVPYEARGQRKDGTVFFCQLQAKEFTYAENKKARVVAIRDITSQKEYEVMLRQVNSDYENLISQSPDGIFILNDQGKILFANPSAHFILGVPSMKSMQDSSVFDYVVPTYHQAIKDRHQLLIEGYDIPFMKLEAIKIDGTIIEIEYKAVSIDYQGGKATLVVYHDIDFQEQLSREKTRLKVADETNLALKQNLVEKEILLKEVHHRVKNNLQVISSILSLQSASITDDKTIELLLECQNRIKSMAYIHESLYQTKNFANINFVEYIQNLINNLIFSYYPKGKKIHFQQEIENVFLNLDTAIPCGLIVNELVSNALKYAFKEKEEGNLFIGVAENKKGQITFIIADDGQGLPLSVDYKNSNSLGLQLVQILVEQLNGKIKLENKNGAKFTLQFNKDGSKNLK